MRNFILIFLCLVSLFVSAQTQTGIVKTRGRLVNGNVVAGQRLSGATVQVKGRNAVVTNANGAFSFPVPANRFVIQSVKKQGYVLVDPEATARQYAYSSNPLIFVLEVPSQQAGDKLEAERKLRRTLSRQLQQREEEIEQLREQNRLTEEQFHQALQDLYAEQERSLNLVSQMAERYAKIDFDQLDDFNRRVSDCIIEGRLIEADSLIKSKGDLKERITSHNKHHEVNVEARRYLEISEAMELKDREDLAEDCYNQFLIHKLQHHPDSAAFYIEQRALLDTTNVDWLCDAASYLKDTGNIDKALSLYLKAHNQYVVRGINDNRHAEILETIADYYYLNKNDAIEEVIEYYNLAIDAFENISMFHPHLVHCYDYLGLSIINKASYLKTTDEESVNKALRDSKIGSRMRDDESNRIPLLYGSRVIMNDIISSQVIDVDNLYFGDVIGADSPDKLVNYYERALFKVDSIYGANNVLYAKTQISLGNAYERYLDRDKALDCYETARRVYCDIDSLHSELGDLYYKLGYNYLSNKKDTISAINYCLRAIQVYQSIFGNYHPQMNLIYSKLMHVYSRQKEYNQALYYGFKSIEWNQHFYGQSRDPGYLSISRIYQDMGNYDIAIEYLDEYRKIIDKKQKSSPSHNLSNYYNGLGDIFFLKGVYPQAIISYQKTIECDSTWSKFGKIGMAYLCKGDTVKALEHFIQSLELLPNSNLFLATGSETCLDIERLNDNLKLYYNQCNFPEAINCFFDFFIRLSQKMISGSF